MKKEINQKLIICLISAILFLGCKKDKDLVTVPPPIVNEPETITTIQLTFTDSAGVAPVVSATFNDPDGDGGNPPTQIDTIRLLPNLTYLTSLKLLDVTKNPVVDLTDEVKNEANDHQLFYTVSGTDLKVVYNDQDSNSPPLPIGLQTKWRSGNTGKGAVKIVLKHQAGTKNGTEGPGETDVDITLPFIVK